MPIPGYFKGTKDAEGNPCYDYDDDAISKSENRYTGYLCFVTDCMNLDVLATIEPYRDKDGVGKVFDDIKNAQDCKRLMI